MLLQLAYWTGSLCRPASSVAFSNTTGPIITKLHVESPAVRGTKACSNDFGLMTDFAAMPIDGYIFKNLLNDQ